MKNIIKIKKDIDIDLGSETGSFELNALSKEIYNSLPLKEQTEEEKTKSIKSIISILEGFSFNATISMEVDMDKFSDEAFIEELSKRIGIKNFVKIKTLEDVFKYNKFVEIWNKYSLEELEKL